MSQPLLTFENDTLVFFRTSLNGNSSALSKARVGRGTAAMFPTHLTADNLTARRAVKIRPATGKFQAESGLPPPPRAFWTALLELGDSPLLLNSQPNALFPVLAESSASAGEDACQVPGSVSTAQTGQASLPCGCFCQDLPGSVRDPPFSTATQVGGKAALGTSLAVRPDGWC